MPTKRTKGVVQLATNINPALKEKLCRYAKRRKERLRTVIERALIREMTYPPPEPNCPPLADAGRVSTP